MKRKFFLTGTMALVLGTLLFTVWGSSTLPSIQAFLNTSYKYSLDGKEILKNVPAIIYNNMTYVPIYNLAQDLGYNVTIEPGQAILTSPNTTPSAPTTPTDSVTINRAQIVAIDFATNRVTVVPAGKSNNIENQIVLIITPETKIQGARNKKIYKISDLQPGINVRVVHSTASTKSIPPQTVAYSLTIL